MSNKNIILGNYYNKYATKNPIERILLNNYAYHFKRIISSLSIKSVYEIGSGEGVLLKWLYEIKSDLNLIGSDISPVFDLSLFKGSPKKPEFLVNNAEQIPLARRSVEMILVCEVLEHVKDPGACLRELNRVDADYYLLTVPNDRLWRILNMIRLRYIKNLGNTPGHINHWSRRSFVKLVSNYLNIQYSFYVHPWIFLVATGNKSN